MLVPALRLLGLHGLADRLEGRSPHWRAVERRHLAAEPDCQWCGGRGRPQVHHIVPFHVDPSKELLDGNLVTLCMDPRVRCHLTRGHRGNWRDYEPDIRRLCRERWAHTPEQGKGELPWPTKSP